MYQHLFAIVDRLPPSWRPSASAPGPVRVRTLDDLAVLACDCERIPPVTARTLAQHHEVVAAAMAADALLPFRFGTVLPEGELAAWLLTHAARIRATLAEIRGAVEMSVKLLRLHCGHGAERSCTECTGAPPDVGELRRLADRLVERAGLERWHFRASANGGNVAGSLAFLVPRDEVGAFLARIAPVASRAAGIAVVPTGPWPAYSFAGSFDRLPLPRVGVPGPMREEKLG